MLMPTTPVHVPVGSLFGGCSANVQDLDIEHKVLAGQGVIGVEVGGELACFYHGSGTVSLFRVDLHQHAGVQSAFVYEVFYRDALLALRVALAIGMCCVKADAEDVTCGLPGHARFQAGQDVADAMQVGARLAVAGCLQFLAGGVAKDVVKGDYGIAFDIHGSARRWQTGRRLQWKTAPQARVHPDRAERVGTGTCGVWR